MSLNKNKIDKNLGKEIHQLLINKGVETPMIDVDVTLHQQDIYALKVQRISDKFKDIMLELGLDLKDDSLQDSPTRVAKMYVNEIFWGLDYSNFPKITTIENKMKYDEMIVESGIQVSSFCEHHFVNIDGLATVAYIPHNKVLGLSKMNRIVEFFSRRPQVQERLTEQIFHTLSYILETDNIGVVINAKHFCVKARGVEDHNCSTVTSKLGGMFKLNESTRQEFMNWTLK